MAINSVIFKQIWQPVSDRHQRRTLTVSMKQHLGYGGALTECWWIYISTRSMNQVPLVTATSTASNIWNSQVGNSLDIGSPCQQKWWRNWQIEAMMLCAKQGTRRKHQTLQQSLTLPCDVGTNGLPVRLVNHCAWLSGWKITAKNKLKHRWNWQVNRIGSKCTLSTTCLESSEDLPHQSFTHNADVFFSSTRW